MSQPLQLWPRLLAGVALLSACPASPTPDPKYVPDDVTCVAVERVSDTAGLTEALGSAGAGACVVPAGGSYHGAFTVPQQVTLVAEVGASVEIVGEDPQGAPAVVLEAGARLVDVTISAAPREGLRVAGHGVVLTRVAIHHAGSMGLVAWCEEDCNQPDPMAHLTDVVLTANGFGLVVHGARVKMVRGRVAENLGKEVVDGMGVVVSHGGRLEMEGTVVEKNRQLGVLVDGAGTTTSLKDVTVSANTGRGVWTQGLRGTDAAPALLLDGCTVERNRLVGVGARDSVGIRVTGGRIAQTELAVTIVDGGLAREVGDGVGLFEASQARLQSVDLVGNQRAQVLVDSAAAGVAVQGGTVTATGTQLGLVVQRSPAGIDTTHPVVKPAANDELPFSAPQFALPTR